MTIRDDELEARLTSVFATIPARAIARRVAERMRHAAAAEPSRSRLASGRRTAVALAAALVAAALLAAVAAATGLFGTLIGGNQSWQQGWDRSVELGIEATLAGGTTVVLERGYADANQVLIGLRSSDAHLIVDGFELSDGTGRQYVMSSGAGETIEDGSIVLQAWVAEEPLPPGETTFSLSTQLEPGVEPSRIEFTLLVEASTDVKTDASATHGGFSVTLHRVVVSPTIIRARMDLQVLPDAPRGGWQAWTPIARFEGPAGSINVGQSGPAAQSDPENGQLVLYSEFGVADWNDREIAGEWKLVVSEIVGFDADGNQFRVSGPWELPFIIP